MVCFFRATDQRRRPEERIVDDPYAKLFLGPIMRAGLATLEATGRLGVRAEEHSPGLVAYVLARHRFIDDRLRAALSVPQGEEGSIAQVVLLGAGYDTRAHRFADVLGSRPVFELDFPSTSRRKTLIATERVRDLPEADVRRVAIDFMTERIEDALEAVGFDPALRTFFIWEGVSMYLTRKAVETTLKTIREIGGRGSEIAMDFWFLLDSPDFTSAAHRMSASFLHLLGEPILFGIHPEDVGPFLERLGFEVSDLADAKALERRYVRDGRNVYRPCYVLHARVR